MTTDPNECYRILEVQPGAGWEEVKRSYRELVRVWHPDRFVHDPPLQHKAQEKLKQINLAFQRLKERLSTEKEYSEPPPKQTDAPNAERFFFEGQKLFFGDGVGKDTAQAAVLLRKASDMGFAPAQYLLGHAY